MEPFRILVVDDEIDFLETIVNRLRKRRFHAEGVQSGEEALEFLKRDSVDVVLLDVKMPGGMDGIDVLRAIKKQQPSTEVILLTGHASVETSLEGMQHGAYDYLLKPVKFEELLIKIAAACEHKMLNTRRS
jgi:DNA-binding NtrC family response regulator